MNKTQYQEYQQAVKANLAHLTFVSTGACEGCDECQGEDSHFSWTACEACGSSLGGDRHPAHGRDKDNAILHFEVCSNCLYYLNYGQLDDLSMLEMEDEQ